MAKTESHGKGFQGRPSTVVHPPESGKEKLLGYGANSSTAGFENIESIVGDRLLCTIDK
jgi:hypothetical protein